MRASGQVLSVFTKLGRDCSVKADPRIIPVLRGDGCLNTGAAPRPSCVSALLFCPPLPCFAPALLMPWPMRPARDARAASLPRRRSSTATGSCTMSSASCARSASSSSQRGSSMRQVTPGWGNKHFFHPPEVTLPFFLQFEGRKYCEHDFQMLFAPCCHQCGERRLCVFPFPHCFCYCFLSGLFCYLGTLKHLL